jgi:hypothetical protein
MGKTGDYTLIFDIFGHFNPICSTEHQRKGISIANILKVLFHFVWVND